MRSPSQKQNVPTKPEKQKPPKPGTGRDPERDRVDIDPRKPGQDNPDVTDKPRPDQEDTRYKGRHHGDRMRPEPPDEDELEEGWAG